MYYVVVLLCCDLDDGDYPTIHETREPYLNAPFPNGVNMQNTHTSGSGVTKSFKTTVRSCPDVIEMSKMRL